MERELEEVILRFQTINSDWTLVFSEDFTEELFLRKSDQYILPTHLTQLDGCAYSPLLPILCIL